MGNCEGIRKRGKRLDNSNKTTPTSNIRIISQSTPNGEILKKETQKETKTYETINKENSIENKLTEEKYNKNEETTKEEKSKVIEEPIKNEEKTLKIILNTKLPSPIKWSQCKIDNFDNHKVLLGYLNAYFDHCPILLNPNIIWQLILNSFSEYINKYHEDLREKLVNFSGKRKIITHQLAKNFSEIKEEEIIEYICIKLSENIKDDMINIMTPNFSTSTKKTIIAGKVSILSTFRQYFNYKREIITCGIPYINLEGSLEDWEKILDKLKCLSKYNFNTSKMEKDIEEIINSKKGNINKDFWRNIIMETENENEKTIYCSNLKEKSKSIYGWICDFYPYMETNIGKDSFDLPSEITKSPLLLSFEKLNEINVILEAGIMDLKQHSDTLCVEPIIDYKLKRLYNKNDERSDIDIDI